METRKSQLTKLTEKYESVSKNETCKLVQSYPSVSQGEISRGNHNPTEKSDPGCPLPKSKDIARGRSIRTIINPIVETNLKAEDLDFLSTEMGDEIARIVVDEIVSLQSLKHGAFPRKPADNFI